MVRKVIVLMILIVVSVPIWAQTYAPVTVSGYNHDVIAEGTGTSSLSTTTKEMDAITPSNFVICTQQFAAANGLPSTYGIYNNGTITATNRTYQLTNLGNGTGTTNNVLYLLKNETGTFTLTTPATYSNLSFLVLATEGAATVNAIVQYTDGSVQFFNGLNITDWVGGANPIYQGFGRLKRMNGPFGAGTYEQAPTNPRFYAVDIATACDKLVNTVTFSNVSSGTNTSSNRAFIFAISGVSAEFPVVPVVSPVSICSGNTATLTVQSPSPTLTYTWYTASAGGSAIATGTSFTTPTLTGTTTYYVQSANSGGCASTRTPVTVTIAPPPTAPVVPATQICSGTTSTLSVTSPQTGVTYSWFTVATGGTAISTGTSFTTPSLTSSTTYYVQASVGGGCVSTRTAVTVTILPPLTAPVIPATQICSGATSTLTVSSPQTGITYSWYAAATGGTAITTGTTYTTPALTTTTTYYVEASNSGGCLSTRTAVTVTVVNPPTAPTIAALQICYGASANLSVSGPQTGITYSWFTVATGGTAVSTGASYTTPALTATTNYYVAASNSTGCVSARTTVTVTVLPQVTVPVVPAVSICSGSTATLSVTSPQTGITYSWFAAATGGTALATGTSFTTPSLTAGTTYYVEASNSANCTSTRGTAVVTILPPLATPAVASVEICSGSTATLSVTSPQTGVTYSWFAAATGGTALATGATFTTPALTAATTYYIQAQNAGGCISTSRGSVTVTIAAPLAAPVVTSTNVTTTSVTFTWSAIPGATGYQVSVNGGTFTSPSSGATGTTHVVSGLTPGTTVNIQVKALGVQTCQNSPNGSASAVTLLSNIFVPNVFTPNADGKNDLFLVYGNDIASIDMKIFNQWGELIYETRDRSKGWDGTYKGKQQPVGVYVYAVNVVLVDGTTTVKKGSFSLVR